jgi:3-oxoacyl-[acyl-carrier protein] reductase
LTNEIKKTAIVTGGMRGIGKAIVKQLAENICTDILVCDVVFPNDNTDDGASEIQKEISNPNVKIYAMKTDVTSFTQAQATVEYAIEKFGRVDILVNNAGITRDNLLLRMSEDDFDKVINVNLKSIFNFTKAILKPMISQRYGRIVNIASVVGVIGNAGQANYSASKAGAIGFTKSMARELASRNITVNALAPGFIETDMTNKLNQTQKEALLKNVPLARMGIPADVAKVVEFFCSASADYLTGQVINVDGGMVM